MKTWIASLMLAGILMPIAATNTQAQIFSNERFNRLQNGKDFGVYAQRIAIFKDYFTRDLPRGAAKGFDDGIHLSTYDYRQWTEEDLRKLAISFNGVDMFSGLMYMKNSATAKDASGDFTRAAIQAQNALTELKPVCCKSWRSFHNMIARVEDATMSQLLPLMKRKGISIPPGYGYAK